MVELGPGLLTSIYDGIQRPLPILQDKMGDFIARGIMEPGLNRTKNWKFVPTVKKGDDVKGGSIIGTVQETPDIKHRVLTPPDIAGIIQDIREGSYTVDDVIGYVNAKSLALMQRWPVRMPRPFKQKLMPDIPLLTGQRIFDALFRSPKGELHVSLGVLEPVKPSCNISSRNGVMPISLFTLVAENGEMK